MRDAFPDVGLKLKYACKALTNLSILKLMLKNGVGIDAVSIEEAILALHVGFSPEEIQFTPSGVTFSEIDKAVELGLRLNIDSLMLLEYIGTTYGNAIPVAIRLNPSIMAGGNLKISTGHADSKFGIPIEYVNQIVEIVKKFNIQVKGLHQHNGSDFKNASVIIEAMEKSFSVALKYFPDLDFIDMGSGFKVPYSPTDSVTDLNQIGFEVTQKFKAFQKEYKKEIGLWFEPGKILVSESGTLLSTCTVVKHNPSRNFVHVDTGLNHLLRPMMYDAYHEIVNTSKLPSHTREAYDVVGYICETDTLGSERDLPEVNPGDILGIKNAGAYAFSMSSNYNSRVRPAEVLIYNGKSFLIRKRESMDDIIRNQIEVDLDE